MLRSVSSLRSRTAQKRHPRAAERLVRHFPRRRDAAALLSARVVVSVVFLLLLLLVLPFV